ncbi:putative protein trichome birefringence-like 33 [Cocos nucifera]|uniref:Trichome birefringence-like C-terminal domain-containing protein n=1 Tax=Cocos nucifera TaxID=13894 RepID=A0A8K0I5H9_COCNU|nr:putative protein trichome birefringence-like 33 [Cocos nucifera]
MKPLSSSSSSHRKCPFSSYLLTFTFIIFVAILYGEDFSCILRQPFRQSQQLEDFQPQQRQQNLQKPKAKWYEQIYIKLSDLWECFNATLMLEMLRGKRMMFVGDSLNRGQYVSMVCLLHRIIPESAKSMETFDSLTVFKAKDYNASIEFYWAPFLVESNSDDAVIHRVTDRIVRAKSINKHARHWKGVDILVFNTYLWWMTGMKMKMLQGSFEGDMKDIVEMETEDAYRLALKRVVKWVDKNMDTHKSRVFFTSMSPTHTS